MSHARIMSANEARDLVPIRRSERFAGAIDYAVTQGKNLCSVNFTARDSEIRSLEKLGYEVTVSRDHDNTFIYWFNKEEIA